MNRDRNRSIKSLLGIIPVKRKGRDQDWAGMVDRQQGRSDRDPESPTERSTLRIT